MATDRQIEANRKNAARSTGPTSESGKARSRLNATRHGMAGGSAAVEAGVSPEFADRRAKWAASKGTLDEAAGWALDRAVAASFRIERCERTVDRLIGVEGTRAALVWDQDRAAEAAVLGSRIARDPVAISKQLETSRAGVDLLLESWLGLLAILEERDWSDPERSRALDLLGVPADIRACRTLVDATREVDPVAFRTGLVVRELDRLESLQVEALVPLDDQYRSVAMTGDLALLTKQAKLVLRYERDAWSRYRESQKQVQAPPQEEAAPPPAARPSRAPVEMKSDARAAAPDRLMAALVGAMGSALPDGTKPIEVGSYRASEGLVVGKTQERVATAVSAGG